MLIFLYTAAFVCLEQATRAQPAAAACPTRCDVSSCPNPSCPGGYAPDRCGCCLVCARGEGEPCGRGGDPPCPDGMECARPGRAERPDGGACQCRSSRAVCGSDGKTYADACHLQATSRRALQQGLSAVTVIQQGPCEASTVQGLQMLQALVTSSTS